MKKDMELANEVIRISGAKMYEMWQMLCILSFIQ